MELYPGMRAHMGRWSYYVVKMTMREVAEGVKFASDVYSNKTLDDALQRTLDESRVKRDLVSYLQRQQDRFFNSLVVAAIGGAPKWYPVSIEDDPRFEVFRDDERLNTTFGILSFDGSQNYYALDGQHRLSAIKALVHPQSDAHRDAPQGFDREEVSVLIVVPDKVEDESEFRERYRRLFGNLNRYAKPMDQVTNIIMDEDDVFSILTRRLVSDHPFFAVTGNDADSYRVKTTKGKNLAKTDAFFTSLETLYAMNETLLSTRARRNAGWGPEGAELKLFKRFRPDDEVIDSLYDELAMYWDGMISAVPDLRRDPVTMRNHAVLDSLEPTEDRDCLLFWPIGQELFVELVRDTLDARLQDPGSPALDDVIAALTPLAAQPWDLTESPWKHFMIVPKSSEGGWTMRNEGRKEAFNVGHALLGWSLGINPLDEDSLAQYKDTWSLMLVPNMSNDEVEAQWAEFADHAG